MMLYTRDIDQFMEGCYNFRIDARNEEDFSKESIMKKLAGSVSPPTVPKKEMRPSAYRKRVNSGPSLRRNDNNPIVTRVQNFGTPNKPRSWTRNSKKKKKPSMAGPRSPLLDSGSRSLPSSPIPQDETRLSDISEGMMIAKDMKIRELERKLDTTSLKHDQVMRDLKVSKDENELLKKHLERVQIAEIKRLSDSKLDEERIRKMTSSLEKAHFEKEEFRKRNLTLERKIQTIESTFLEYKKLSEKMMRTNELSLLRSEIERIQNINDSLLRAQNSRFSNYLKKLDEEEFWVFEPSKYFSNHGKLEFHHNISRTNAKFICRFKPEKSKFHSAETYEELDRACSFFENVVVNISEDKVLTNFLRDVIEKEYMDEIRAEQHKKSPIASQEMKILVQKLILQILGFFHPMVSISMSEEDCRRVIREGIRESQKKRGGNSVYIGDMQHKIGYCRHRATLVKVVCDFVGIRCKLQSVYGFHAWNVIQLGETFYYVDAMNCGDRLCLMEEYYTILRKMIEKEDSITQEQLIQQLVIDQQTEEKRMDRLKRYTKDELREEFRVSGSKKGGGGDVSLYTLQKDIHERIYFFKDQQVNTTRPQFVDICIFQKNEVIAIKKIVVKDDGPERGHEMLLDGIPRRYALREASHMKLLDHPSIIDVLCYWESEDEHNLPCVFIAMNSMDQDGRCLLNTLTRKKNVKKSTKQIEVIFMLLETARGLRYLSSLNIVHLDVKPENVMVKWDESKQQIEDVRIIDFGGAKNNDIVTSNFMNTEGYDAPEIRDIKRKKKIRILMDEIRSEFRKVSYRKRKVQNLVNNAAAEFLRVKNMTGLTDCFAFIAEKCVNMRKLAVTAGWIEEIKKKIQRCEMEQQHQQHQHHNRTGFDCRADIYSFGIMVEEYLEKELIPQELEGLKERCIEEDRRDRPSIDEIVHVLKKHLSYFNQKLKEEEEGNQ